MRIEYRLSGTYTNVEDPPVEINVKPWEAKFIGTHFVHPPAESFLTGLCGEIHLGQDRVPTVLWIDGLVVEEDDVLGVQAGDIIWSDQYGRYVFTYADDPRIYLKAGVAQEVVDYTAVPVYPYPKATRILNEYAVDYPG